MSCKSHKKHSTGDMGEEVVKLGVGVGNMRQTFPVHKCLVQKYTKFFDKALETDTGKSGNVFLNDEDPEVFAMFVHWLYNGTVANPPVSFTGKANMPPAELERLEVDLRVRFNKHECKLICLFAMAEKYSMSDLMNRAIDAIQDGYFLYGTVFGPGFNEKIFKMTKKGSKLRDLCIGANFLHMDRGCTGVRKEIMQSCDQTPGYFAHMLKWVACNFHMISRRYVEGFDNRNSEQGFSILNRKKLCPCLFHTHEPKQAHKGHAACAVPVLDCSHGEDDEAETEESENVIDFGNLPGLANLAKLFAQGFPSPSDKGNLAH